jgi:hypothetical protein
MPQTIPRKQVQRVPPPQPPSDPLTRPEVTKVATGPSGRSKTNESRLRSSTSNESRLRSDVPKGNESRLRSSTSNESDSEEEELSFESIVRDKPSPKKIAIFVQACINQLIGDSDDEKDQEMDDSDFSRT